MRENKQALYFNMILGTIGTLLIALTAMRYLENEKYNKDYPIILFGFILTVGYFNYLEKKAGISKRLTWIRVAVSIILFVAFSYFLYF